jgi:uncharacterized protein YlzI (FlbEa/FlbD family)
VIAVTCRNGEHFTLDPDTIERVETGGDTTVILEDGTKYVIGQGLDELVRIVRDHRAALVTTRARRFGGPFPSPGMVPARSQAATTSVPEPALD